MNNPTQLLPTDLILVEVPKDATEIKLGCLGIAVYFEGASGIDSINLKEFAYGNFEILGEVTADSISFDCKPYVEKNNNGYKNYLIVPNEFNPSFESPKESFYSLLQSNGIYFVNPIEKLDVSDFDNGVGIEYDNFYRNVRLWQEAESKLIKKGVILKRL